MGDVVDEVDLLILRDRGTGGNGESEKRRIGETERRGPSTEPHGGTGETERTYEALQTASIARCLFSGQFEDGSTSVWREAEAQRFQLIQ